MSIELQNKPLIKLQFIDNPMEPNNSRRFLLVDGVGRTLSEVLAAELEGDPEDWMVILAGRVIVPNDRDSVILVPEDEVIVYSILQGASARLIIGAVVTAAGVYFQQPWLTASGIAMMTGSIAEIIIGPPRIPKLDTTSSATYGFSGIGTSNLVGAVIPVVYGTHRVGGQYIELFVRAAKVISAPGDYGTAYKYASGFLTATFDSNTVTLTGASSGAENVGIGDLLTISVYSDQGAAFRRGYYARIYKITSRTPDTGGSISSLTIDPVYRQASVVGIPAAGTVNLNPVQNHNLPAGIWSIESLPKSEADSDILHALIALSEGEIEAVTDIRINDQAAGNYRDIETSFNVGTNTQTAIPEFGDSTVTEFTADAAIVDTSWTTYTSSGINLTAIELNIIFPGGLFSINNEGEIQSRSVTFNIEFKLTSAGSWTSYGAVTLSDAKRTAIRRTIRKEGLVAGQYDIRIQRTSPEAFTTNVQDAVRRSSINEIVNDGYVYPNVALLGVRALATDQVSGGMPNITCLVQGKKVRVYTTTSSFTTVWSNNPAWIVLDMLINTRYGLAMDVANIDIQSLIDWADFCDTLVDDGNGGTDKRATFDGVFDLDALNVWDAVLQVCHIGYAAPIKVGKNIRIKVEKAENPVQPFSMANVIRGSFKETFLPLKDRANVFEVRYLNAANDYQQDVLTLEDPLIYTNTEPYTKQSVTAYGITRASHGMRYCRFLYRGNRLLGRLIEFDVGIDAIACEPGDVIRFQHDIPQWGFSARARDGSLPTTLILDTPMTVGPSGTYEVLVRHANDVIEIKTVTSPPGTYTVLFVGTAWTLTPAKGDIVLFGPTGFSFKPYRVISIERTPELNAKMTALEYSGSLYDESDAVPIEIVNYSSLPDPFSPPPQVTDLELIQLNDGRNTVMVSFTPPTDLRYVRAAIYEFIGGRYVKLGESRTGNFAIPNLSPGYQITVAVVSVSRIGSESNILEAPFATLNVGNNLVPPPTVTGLELLGQGHDVQFVGKDAKFQWRDRSLISGAGIEGIGHEVLGAGAGGVDPTFKNYRVEIYNTNGTTLRRREYVVDPFYIYSYEKNHEDGVRLGSGVVRSAMIRVWQQDVFNQISVTPAILTVDNPAPGIVSNLTATALERGIRIQVDPSREIDLVGYRIHQSTSTGFTPDASNLVYDGTDPMVQFDNLVNGTTYYFKVAAYDTYGTDALNYSGQVSSAPTGLSAANITGTIGALQANIGLLQVKAGTWTDDDPGAGSVSWAGIVVFLDGVSYPITDADTNEKWIYWSFGDSVLTTSASTFPILGPTDYLIGWNDGGTFKALWNNWLKSGLIVGDLIAANTILASHLAVTTLSAITATLGTVEAGDITSSRFRTATTGQRIDINPSNDNEIHFYGDRGDATIVELATIGITTIGSDGIIGVFGASQSNKIAISAISETNISISAYSVGNIGIYARTDSSSSAAIVGFSADGYGGQFTCYDIDLGTGLGALILTPTSSSSAPSHTAQKGAVWPTLDCVVYINTDGGTTWQKLGAQ